MSMEIIKVGTKDELDYLYKNSALTIEGLTEESIPDLMEFIKNNTTVYRERVFVISGKLMNQTYHLTGDNRYPEDLNIISVALEDFNAAPFTFLRFTIGGRWFDDIVDNNARRESGR